MTADKKPTALRDSVLVLDGLKNQSKKPTIERSLLKRLYWIPRTFVSRAKDCTATSLPLHFYFGYQILQVKEREEDLGHVMYLFM